MKRAAPSDSIHDSQSESQSADSKIIEEILQNLKPTQDEEEGLQLHNNLRGALAKVCGESLKESFLSGSYARSTNIRGHSDVDIDLIFDRTHPDLESDAQVLKSWLLNKVSEALAALKSDSVIDAFDTRTQDRSVGANVRRKGSKLGSQFDFIPLLRHSSGGTGVEVIRGGKFHTFIGTYPKQATDDTKRSCKANPRARNLIRLVKAWNYSKAREIQNDDPQKPFKSFHLERLVLNYVKSLQATKSWKELITGFFGYLDINFSARCEFGVKSLSQYLIDDLERKSAAEKAIEEANKLCQSRNWKKLFPISSAVIYSKFKE